MTRSTKTKKRHAKRPLGRALEPAEVKWIETKIAEKGWTKADFYTAYQSKTGRAQDPTRQLQRIFKSKCPVTPTVRVNLAGTLGVSTEVFDASLKACLDASPEETLDLDSPNAIALALNVGNEALLRATERLSTPAAEPVEPRSSNPTGAERSGQGDSGTTDSHQNHPVRYWEAAPSAIALHGRDAEFKVLTQHSRRKTCRIIGLFGNGGIGKTALASAVMRAVTDDFEFLYWHDLRDAPPLEEVLHHCLYVLSDFQSSKHPADAGNLILDLVSHMCKRRTLLVLDNFETMMEASKSSYRPGYSEYGSLIRKLGETDHVGCVILTSREKPPEWTLLEDGNHSIVTHPARGLSNNAGAQILKQRRLMGSTSQFHAVVRLCSGNPGALKHVSAQIEEVYLGNVADYLRVRQRLPARVQDILSEQVSRLSTVERDLLYWLAIARDTLTIDSLRDHLLTQDSKEETANGLSLLLNRNLVLRTDDGFTLENLVLEYLTDRLVDEFAREITTGSMSRSNSHAMLVATAKEHVRSSQSRLLLRPVRDRLLARYSSNGEATQYLWSLLERLRTQRSGNQGYAAGNLINLLCELGADFTGCELSDLTIWQAYLREVALKRVSFRNSEFARCAFVETFSGIMSVAVSSDGTLLATGDAHGEILVWNVTEDQVVFRQRPHVHWVRCVAFSPDDQFLATGSDDNSVMIFRVDSGAHRFTLHGHSSRVRSLAWSLDARLLASAGNDNVIKLWSADTGELISSIRGHLGHVRSIAFFPDSKRLVSGGEDCLVKVWDLETGRCLKTVIGHSQPVCAVAVSPDGELISSGGEDQIVKLWDAEGGSRGLLSGHTSWVWSIAFSHDGKKLATCGGDRSARLWDLKTLRCLRSFEGHANWVRSVAFSGNDRMLVTGSDDRTIRMWDLSSGQCVKVLRGHSNPMWTVAFSPDKSLLASSGNDESITLWNLATGSVIGVLRGHESWVWTVAFSPDGKCVGSASGDVTARIWDLAGSHVPIVLRGHDNQVRSIAFDPKSRFVITGSDDRTARVWDLATGRCLRVLQGHESQVWAVAVNPEGSLVATASDDQTVRLWDALTGECAATLTGHTNRVLSVAFSQDGLWLASGSEDRTVRLWRTPFSEQRVLAGHMNWVQAVAFCNAGKTLVSGSDDETVILWDVASAEPIKVLRDHSDWVQAITATDDGTMFASGSQDGTIRIWDVGTLSCLRTLRVGRLYENMDITDIQGLTEAQIDNLKALGASMAGSLAV